MQRVFNGSHLHVYIYTLFSPHEWCNVFPVVSKAWRHASRSDALWHPIKCRLLSTFPRLKLYAGKQPTIDLFSKIYNEYNDLLLHDLALASELLCYHIDDDYYSSAISHVETRCIKDIDGMVFKVWAQSLVTEFHIKDPTLLFYPCFLIMNGGPGLIYLELNEIREFRLFKLGILVEKRARARRRKDETVHGDN